ncbi:Cellulase [Psidium guajava]|nr:Cellulase [Psidium guajava]
MGSVPGRALLLCGERGSVRWGDGEAIWNIRVTTD